MKIGCPSCKKAIFESSLRKCLNCGKEFTDKEIKSRTKLTMLAYFSVGLAFFMLLLAFFLPKMEVTIQDDIVESSDRQTAEATVLQIGHKEFVERFNKKSRTLDTGIKIIKSHYSQGAKKDSYRYELNIKSIAIVAAIDKKHKNLSSSP